MAIAVPNQWPASGSENDIEVRTLPTSGSWMLAVVSWRSVDGTVPQVTVADLPRNLWTLLGTSDHTAAATHAQVWACPKAMFDGFSTLNLYVAAMAISASDVGTVDVSTFEVTGLSDAMTIDSVTVAFASAATTFSIVMPAPAASANCLMVGAAAIDNAAATLTVTSAGWTALTQVSRTAPDLRMGPAWRTSTTTQTPAWSSSVAANWVGIAVSIKETGTPLVNSNPNYPRMQFQLGLGYDVSTPLQAVTWTEPVGRHLSTAHQRGIQAELGVAQPELTALRFRNDDGAFASRTAMSATLSAAGTTTTAKMLDAAAVGLYKGDWFQLRTAAGALKETTVFQVTATPTSAAGTTTLTFSPAAAVATAGADVLTTTPVDVYTPYRLLATWQGKTHAVCAGWLESCVQSFDVESFGMVDATGVDALRMQDTTSLTALRGEILRRSPTHSWPLDDPAGSTAAQNDSGISQAQLVTTMSKYGPGSGTADFGANTQNLVPFRANQSILGDAASGFAQSGLLAAELATKGSALVGQDTAFPAISGGVTIFGCLYIADADQTLIGSATVDPTVMILRNLDPGTGISQGSIIKLSMEHTAGVNQYGAKLTVWDAATHAATTTNVSALRLGGAWGTWAVSFNRTGWSVYVAGNLQASGAANLVNSFQGINIGGEADAFSHSRFFNAIHAHVAVFGRRLSQQEIFHLNRAVIFGVGQLSETAEQRIQRKLNVAGWKGARAISSSGLVMASEGTETASVAAKNSDVASYEDGQVFADAAAQTQFRSRAVSYQQSSRATLGELTGSGEIPYTKDVQVKLDPTFVYNVIRVANTLNPRGFGLSGAGTGGSNPATTTTSVAADTTSARKYRPNPLDPKTRLASQADAFALACWLLARFATPQRRITQLTIQAAPIGNTTPAVFTFCLSVEVGDLVTVNRRPVGAPPTSQLYRVLHVQQTQGPGQWTTVLSLALAPAPSLIVGDPVKGILGNNSMAA
jgi:hypothetical protein